VYILKSDTRHETLNSSTEQGFGKIFEIVEIFFHLIVLKIEKEKSKNTLWKKKVGQKNRIVNKIEVLWYNNRRKKKHWRSLYHYFFLLPLIKRSGLTLVLKKKILLFVDFDFSS
jgi:hypothetical protein